MQQKVETEISRLTNMLMGDQNTDGSWTYPFETGIATDCYMIILLRTLQINDEELIQSLVNRILDKQDKDGTWKLFYDEKGGNLSATLEAYYALLYSGYRTKNEPEISSARQFLLENMETDKLNIFTKILLMLTGQLPWPRHFLVPVESILLPVTFPVNLFDFSVYARANFIPIVVAAEYKFSLKTKHAPNLSPILLSRGGVDWKREQQEWRSFLTSIQHGINNLIGYPHHLREMALQQAEKYMLDRIEPDGTFYSYFSSTFLMIFALMARGYPKDHPIILKAVQGMLAFKTNITKKTHIQYTTATVWNTALISTALQEAGISPGASAIQKAHQYLQARQHYIYGDWAIHNPNVLPGGWGFSDSNTINPDVDDTTAALRSICRRVLEDPVCHHMWDRGVRWTISMQNNDGGWPSFERNVDKSFLALLPVEGKEAMLLDPSTADLTGRTLEFLGNYTHLTQYQSTIKRGRNWLLNKQEKDGSWYGRWGICYIYGTWAAVTGLTATGIRKDNPSVQKSVKWLYDIQNEDGGWGESCYSDIEQEYVALHASTRVHTAWALDALIAAEDKVTQQLEQGIMFLLKTWDRQDWTTIYPKGQGLRGGFYIHYHSYEFLFPLLALSHYKEKFC